MNYKYVIVFAGLLFGYANAMELDPDKQREECMILDDASYSVEKFGRTESLATLTARVIAKKFMKDIRSDIETGSKEEAYKKYLASTQLNGPSKELILKALAKNEPNLLWKILSFNVVQENLGIAQNEAISLKDIIVLNKNKLLVLYDEKQADGQNKRLSKIKIWNMRTDDWVDVNFSLPEICVRKALISKDLKTLFLWCYGCFILVYDLETKCEISRIISSPDVIKSVCLLNDKFICYGTGRGEVKIFDRNTGEEIFAFEANDNQPIRQINAIGDYIITVDQYFVYTWKLYMGENKKAIKVGEKNVTYTTVIGIEGCLDCQKILMEYGYPDKHFLETLTLPELERVDTRRIDPGLCMNSLKKNLDGKLIFMSRHHRLIQNEITIKELIIIDGESRNIINKIDLNKILLADNIDIKWEDFAISPNSDYIILYDKKGNIGKIGLNFDQDLGKVLAGIKSELKNPTKYVDRRDSRCLIS